MAALTDSVNTVSYDPISRPGVSNLLQLLSYFSNPSKSPDELGKELAGHSLGRLKVLLSEKIATTLEPIRHRYGQFMAEDGGQYLDDVEARGAEKAGANAKETMTIVRDAVGL
jgi:tryptophanyl-tRNA synthetase